MSARASDYIGRVILAALLAPILGGAIVYYSLRRSHRDIANLGNRMSWVACLLWIAVAVGLDLPVATILPLAQVIGIALAGITVSSIKKTAMADEPAQVAAGSVKTSGMADSMADELVSCVQCGQFNRVGDAHCIRCEAPIEAGRRKLLITGRAIWALGVLGVVLLGLTGYRYLTEQAAAIHSQSDQLSSVQPAMAQAFEGEPVRSLLVTTHRVGDKTILGVHWTPETEMTEDGLRFQMERVWSKLEPNLGDDFQSVVLIPRKDKRVQVPFFSYEDMGPLAHKVYGQPLSPEELQAVIWSLSRQP